MRKRLRRYSLPTLPFWFCDYGQRPAARKATACADASGPRARELFPTTLPCGSLEKLRAQTLHSTALIPAHISIARRQRRTGVNTTDRNERAMAQNLPRNAEYPPSPTKRWHPIARELHRFAQPFQSTADARQQWRKSGHEQETTDIANRRQKGVRKSEQKTPKKT